MPRYGFNSTWMFSQDTPDTRPQSADLTELDLVAGLGMNFVRIPTDYRFWTRFRLRSAG